MSYKANSYSDELQQICKYYSPLSHTSNSCVRGNRCNFKHLPFPEFEAFCYKQTNSSLRHTAFYYQTGDIFDCANYAFNILIQREPNHRVNNFGLAQSFEGLQNYHNASKHFKIALELAPNDDRCHSLYAHFLHSKVGDLHSAKKYYVNALRINTNNAFTHCNYGKLLYDCNDFDDAEYHYLKCFEINPRHRKCLYYLSRFYHYCKGKIDLQKSKKYFDALMNIVGRQEIKSWNDYYEYAKLLKELGSFDECLNNFKIALNHCTNDNAKSDIYYQIGHIYDQCRFDVQNAKFYFEKASQLRPNHYSIFFGEFLAHHNLGKSDANNNGNNTRNQRNECDTNAPTKNANMNQNWTANTETVNVSKNEINSNANNTNKKTENITRNIGNETQNMANNTENKPKIVKQSNKSQKKATNDTLNNWTEFGAAIPKAQPCNTEEKQSPKQKQSSKLKTVSIATDKQNIKNISFSSPQMEFKLYLSNMKLEMYYDRFVENGCDDMRFLEIFDENMLANSIRMTEIHLKYFTKQSNKFMQSKGRMEDWLKQLGYDLYTEYYGVFERHGIFNFESFYRIVPTKECLVQMIGIENEYDAKFIWYNTPKQARKKQCQSEGV